MDFLSGPEVTAQGLMVLNGKRVDLEWKYGRIFFCSGAGETLAWVAQWKWMCECGCPENCGLWIFLKLYQVLLVAKICSDHQFQRGGFRNGFTNSFLLLWLYCKHMYYFGVTSSSAVYRKLPGLYNSCPNPRHISHFQDPPVGIL